MILLWLHDNRWAVGADHQHAAAGADRFIVDIDAELRKAKDIALGDMRKQARHLGANAIVGIDLDYETICASSSMLMVSASGTAVVVEPE